MQNTLLIINFSLGDSEVPFWAVPIVVKASLTRDKIAELEDSFSSYFESDYDEDEDYESSTANVLNATDLCWEPFAYNKHTPIDDIYQMYV